MSEFPAISAAVPREIARRFVWIPDKTRSMGIHLLAGKGSGKSRLMGRGIGWIDFVRGVPTVILDPNGPTIFNFLDKMTRLPKEYQKQLWKRVIYVDMSGKDGYVVPFPLYYRLTDTESAYHTSQRYLEAVRRMDPALQSASIQGWNALWRIGTYTGMVLAALGFQITEAEHLLSFPEAWEERFSQALERNPDVAPAVAFFRQQYLTWKEDKQTTLTDAFRTKIAVFQLDPTARAMFGASSPGIDWQQVVAKRQIVLLDFSRELDPEMRRFKMLWVFLYFLEFVKQRGAGRHCPISFIIDELTALYNFGAQGADIFSADLDELINVIARNYAVWLTLAHQEMYQVSVKAQKTLLTMGTQIFGSTADMDAALMLARQFYKYDPYKVKRYENVYTSYQGMSWAIDERPVEFTLDAQQVLKSYAIKEQPSLHFLVRPALAEGDVRGEVKAISIKRFDENLWVNEELVAQVRALLRKRSGVPVEQVGAEIHRRSAPMPPTQQRQPATMKPYGRRRATTLPTPSTEDDDDDILRETK